MGRPSRSNERRAQIVAAFGDLLATSGYEGATIAAVADRAGLAPGNVHHYFRDKAEILTELISDLVRAMGQRTRARASNADSAIDAFIDATLALDAQADQRMARCWVGVLAEAQRSPHVMQLVRGVVQGQLTWLVHAAGLRDDEALAMLSFVMGAIVVGTIHQPSVPGFAAPAARRLHAALRPPATRRR